jgi:hypothetical protein
VLPLLCPIGSKVVLSFSLNSKNFDFLPYFFSDHWIWSNMSFSPQVNMWSIFWCFFFVDLVIWHCCQYAGDYFNFLIFVRLAFYVKYDLFLRKFHGLLRLYIVLFQDGILCRWLSDPFDLWYHSVVVFLCQVFVQMIC